MRINLENTEGHVIISDVTGKILSVHVNNAIEGKWDSLATTSYSNLKNGKHQELIIWK